MLADLHDITEITIKKKTMVTDCTPSPPTPPGTEMGVVGGGDIIRENCYIVLPGLAVGITFQTQCRAHMHNAVIAYPENSPFSGVC